MTMMNYILFLLVILLTNIIQGITGFAGTILAMPPGLMLVGYPVAKPVLDVLGLLSGIYYFPGSARWTFHSERGAKQPERSDSDSVPAGIAGPLSDTDSGRYRTRDFRIGRPASDQLSDKKNTG